jgi:hypothetical protein
MIKVLLPGATEVSMMDEADLLKLEGGFENENEQTTWVQYHLPATGELVHRSAHVNLKQTAAEGHVASFG